MSSNWKLDCGPDGIILFGPQASQYPFSDAPEIGDPNRATQDSDLPGSDGVFFGTDTVAGLTIAFQLNAVGETDTEAAALYQAFRKVWRADSIRADPNATAMLTAPSGRSIFGRPRRITPINHPDDAGVVGINADFATQGDLWYGDEQQAVATLGYRAVGGFKFPVKFPLTTSPESDRSQVFTVGGDVATWGVYEITGPVVSPWFEIPGLARYSFTGLRLAYDQWLTIDTRPWAREVYRNDGAPLGGALDASSTLLASAPLPPGRHELLLRGTTTGTPRVTATWRDAFTTH